MEGSPKLKQKTATKSKSSGDTGGTPVKSKMDKLSLQRVPKDLPILTEWKEHLMRSVRRDTPIKQYLSTMGRCLYAVRPSNLNYRSPNSQWPSTFKEWLPLLMKTDKIIEYLHVTCKDVVHASGMLNMTKTIIRFMKYVRVFQTDTALQTADVDIIIDRLSQFRKPLWRQSQIDLDEKKDAKAETLEATIALQLARSKEFCTRTNIALENLKKLTPESIQKPFTFLSDYIHLNSVVIFILTAKCAERPQIAYEMTAHEYMDAVAKPIAKNKLRISVRGHKKEHDNSKRCSVVVGGRRDIDCLAVYFKVRMAMFGLKQYNNFMLNTAGKVCTKAGQTFQRLTRRYLGKAVSLANVRQGIQPVLPNGRREMDQSEDEDICAAPSTAMAIKRDQRMSAIRCRALRVRRVMEEAWGKSIVFKDPLKFFGESFPSSEKAVSKVLRSKLPKNARFPVDSICRVDLKAAWLKQLRSISNAAVR